jgi:hypothetical protein
MFKIGPLQLSHIELRAYIDVIHKAANSFFMLAFINSLKNFYDSDINLRFQIFTGAGMLLLFTLLYVTFIRPFIVELMEGKILNPTKTGVASLVNFILFGALIIIPRFLDSVPGTLIIFEFFLFIPFYIMFFEQLKMDGITYEGDTNYKHISLKNVNIAGYAGFIIGIILFRLSLLNYIPTTELISVFYIVIYAIGIIGPIYIIISEYKQRMHEKNSVENKEKLKEIGRVKYITDLAQGFSDISQRVDYHLIFFGVMIPTVIYTFSLSRFNPDFMHPWFSILIELLTMICGFLVAMVILIGRENTKKNQSLLFLIKYSALISWFLAVIFVNVFINLSAETGDPTYAIMAFIFKILAEFLTAIAAIPAATNLVFGVEDERKLQIFNFIIWLMFLLFLIGGLFIVTNDDLDLLGAYFVLGLIMSLVSGGLWGIRKLLIEAGEKNSNREGNNTEGAQ